MVDHKRSRTHSGVPHGTVKAQWHAHAPSSGVAGGGALDPTACTGNLHGVVDCSKQVTRSKKRFYRDSMWIVRLALRRPTHSW